MLTQNRLKYQTNCYYLEKSYNNFENVNYGYAVFGENYKIQSFLYLKKKKTRGTHCFPFNHSNFFK